jgi:hypothetical protein
MPLCRWCCWEFVDPDGVHRLYGAIASEPEDVDFELRAASQDVRVGDGKDIFLGLDPNFVAALVIAEHQGATSFR